MLEIKSRRKQLIDGIRRKLDRRMLVFVLVFAVGFIGSIGVLSAFDDDGTPLASLQSSSLTTSEASPPSGTNSEDHQAAATASESKEKDSSKDEPNMSEPSDVSRSSNAPISPGHQSLEGSDEHHHQPAPSANQPASAKNTNDALRQSSSGSDSDNDVGSGASQEDKSPPDSQGSEDDDDSPDGLVSGVVRGALYATDRLLNPLLGY